VWCGSSLYGWARDLVSLIRVPEGGGVVFCYFLFLVHCARAFVKHVVPLFSVFCYFY
jgi:hypothetical protein